ncbi:MAG TPA: SDR family NAD(P)-dependent oxidoreductase [Deltaproteobacteria bacterium]|nr:SDR family NAD(P)-dependent oxidoreductase [Deltaproteobacteria bacterium]
MKNLKDKIVVITGAASGIGLEMAREFSREGAKLVLADINATALEGVKKDFEELNRTVHTHVLDVTKQEQIKDFCDNVYRKTGRVDVLCNNAGVGWAGKFEDWTLESWEQIVAINLWSVIYGCHYFYPRMIAQGGGGHIVNTASGAGLHPSPLLSAYCTTKHGVVGFTETLRAEAALNGVDVTCVCPGIVKTNITVTGKVFSSTAKSTSAQLVKKLDDFYIKAAMKPEYVAKQIVKAVKKNTAVLRIGPDEFFNDNIHRVSRALHSFVTRKTIKLVLDRL